MTGWPQFPCAFWCEADHTTSRVCEASVGQVQIGPAALDVVMVRLIADWTIPASVAVLPISAKDGAGMFLDPPQARGLYALLTALGHEQLADLVLEAADVISNREGDRE